MQRDTLLALEPGDEVLTGAGIFGTVQHIQGDRVTLWTGTGSTITVLRRTIARKLEDEDPDYDADDEHAASEHDSWEDQEAPEHDGVAALDEAKTDNDVDEQKDAEPGEPEAAASRDSRGRRSVKTSLKVSLLVTIAVAFIALASTLAAGWSPKLGLDLAGDSRPPTRPSTP